MPTDRLFVVDRLEGPTVVLVDEAEHTVSLPADRFQVSLIEGVVLRVPVNEHDSPNWFAATVDDAETDRRRDNAEAAPDELRSENDASEGDS